MSLSRFIVLGKRVEERIENGENKRCENARSSIHICTSVQDIYMDSDVMQNECDFRGVC